MEILNQFGINPILLLAQAVNFLILLFILKKFLYKPILKVLEERKKRIGEGLKDAEEIEKRLLEIGQLQEKEIQNATKLGQQIIKDATDSANQLYEEAKVNAGQLSVRLVKQTQLELQQEKQEFENSIRENVSDLVFTIIQKVTGKILTKQDRMKIAEESIKMLRP